MSNTKLQQKYNTQSAATQVQAESKNKAIIKIMPTTVTFKNNL